MHTDAATGTPTAPARLLVADDDRAIRDSLQRVLTLEGYEVATVADGAQALESARAQPVDLMVLDLMMPAVDGLTVCRVLRAEGDRTPILMLTARTETSDRVAGLDAGADDYLPKPFDPAELLARVRALLRRDPPRARVRAPDAPGGRPPPGPRGTARLARRRRSWSCPRPSSTCSSCCCSTRASCWAGRASTRRSGTTTSGPTRRTWRSTSATCAARSTTTHDMKLIHTVRGVGYTLRAD